MFGKKKKLTSTVAVKEANGKKNFEGLGKTSERQAAASATAAATAISTQIP